jgi:hypothetical protein
MSSFVEIGTGVGDILSIAYELQRKGEELAGGLASGAPRIGALESAPRTFPPDEFTTPFLEKAYYKAVESSDGNSARLADAVRESGPLLGKAMAGFGEFVADAVVALSGGDTDNAIDLARQSPGLRMTRTAEHPTSA